MRNDDDLRRRAEPRVGCGAALLREGRLLLIRRARAPESGAWGLPGGKVDLFEPVETAVRREIAEELGVQLGALRLLCVMDLIDEAAGEHWVAPIWRADSWSGEPAIQEPEKHTGLGWFALDELPEPLTAAARAAVDKLAPR
jgi:ADP-ribose pyrophosphatase YjhB (NUDIX family)